MSVTLGVNHMFLFPDAMVDEKAHTRTLKELAQYENLEALDCWLWRGETALEEKRILLDSGKIINYNVGDRFGEETQYPTSKNKAERDRAYSALMREIGYALDLNSKKIIFAGGPDDPSDREGAKDRLLELVLKVGAQLPQDVELSFEPTDRDLDKYFLFGPMDETVEFINRVRSNGFERIGLLIDMCHVPIIYESLESAIEKGKDVLNHVHLGNSVVKNPSSVYFRDKHPPFNCADSEFKEEDVIKMAGYLKNIGYIDKNNAAVSFEMRPYEGSDAKETVKRFLSLWQRALESIN